MFFFDRENAAQTIKDFVPKLNAGTCRVYVEGPLTPQLVRWRPADATAPLEKWTRLIIQKVTPSDGSPRGYRLMLETWPDGALRNPNLKPLHQKIVRFEEPRP